MTMASITKLMCTITMSVGKITREKMPTIGNKLT